MQTGACSEDEIEAVKGLYLLTMKPVTYAANVAEGDLANKGATNKHVAALRVRAEEEGRQVVIVSAQVPSLPAPIDRCFYIESVPLKHEPSFFNCEVIQSHPSQNYVI